MPAHDVTVTGSFTINHHRLVYILDNQQYKSYTLDYGTIISPEANPDKEGYTFSGWSVIPETMPDNDVYVYGSFTINHYKLTYLIDGEEYCSYDVEYDASIIAEPNPTKEGHTFSGWSWIPSKMPAEDVTVTGSFTVNKYIITYIVDGELLTEEEVDYGSTILPPTSQKEGYSIVLGRTPDDNASLQYHHLWQLHYWRWCDYVTRGCRDVSVCRWQASYRITKRTKYSPNEGRHDKEGCGEVELHSRIVPFVYFCVIQAVLLKICQICQHVIRVGRLLFCIGKLNESLLRFSCWHGVCCDYK